MAIHLDRPLGEGSGNRFLVIGRPLVTLGDPPVLPEGAVVVDEGVIAWVGPKDALGDHDPFDATFGGDSSIVLPGLANGHYHSDFEMGWEWQEYPIERGWPHAMASDSSEELAYLSALSHLVAAVKGGQTTILDFLYGRPRLGLLGYEAVLRAYRDLGMRGAFALAMRDQSPVVHGVHGPTSSKNGAIASKYGVQLDEQFEALDELVSRTQGDPNYRVMPGPDTVPSCSDQLLLRCVDVARDMGTGMSMHVLETRLELEYAIQQDGRGAMARLRDLGVLGPATSCAHFVWATDDDMAILVETGAIAVFNPGSNLRLGSGIARLRHALAANARVAFGTDTLSFSSREDLLEEIRLAEHLQRVTGDLTGGRLSSARLLEAACVTGAAAAGFVGSGRLEVGAPADLVVCDGEFAHRLADETGAEILDVVVDAARGSDVRTVLIGGRVIVEDGVVVTIDEAAITDMSSPAPPRRRGLSSQERAVDEYVLSYYGSWPARSLEPGGIYNARSVDKSIHSEH